MNVYEPELIYALDSKDEYSDWRSVYNAKADDVFYCPICLGRVKLWNGQDKNKLYKKQKCFHHIDGMCSQESRIHFAYKHWLLETGSKFKVGDNIYEVKESFIEITLKTKFGNYCPDIIVTTLDDKTFYVEIANTNKKTEEYITKWDELGNDVIEIDVNKQLLSSMISKIPEFKMIYSSTTGECYINHSKRNEYVDLISERKNFWKRKNLLEYKIQWERLDWFWHHLQLFYNNKAILEDLIESFKNLDPKDQVFICKRLRGKHSFLKFELEKHYTNKDDLKKGRLRYIDNIIREINKDFNANNKYNINCVHLCRKRNYINIYFLGDVRYYDFEMNDDTTKNDIYNYFHSEMVRLYEHFYNLLKVYFKSDDKIEYMYNDIIPFIKMIKRKFNTCKNKLWSMNYNFSDNENEKYCYFNFEIWLYDYWHGKYNYYIDLEKDSKCIHDEIDKLINEKMKRLIDFAKIGNDYYRLIEVEDKKIE